MVEEDKTSRPKCWIENLNEDLSVVQWGVHLYVETVQLIETIEKSKEIVGDSKEIVDDSRNGEVWRTGKINKHSAGWKRGFEKELNDNMNRIGKVEIKTTSEVRINGVSTAKRLEP